MSGEFPPGCTGGPPVCTQAVEGSRILSVTFGPRDLPEGNMLAYKNLPAVSAVMEGGATVPFSLTGYNHTNHNLTLGFEVPAEARTFGLKWADLVEIPLNVDGQ